MNLIRFLFVLPVLLLGSRANADAKADLLAAFEKTFAAGNGLRAVQQSTFGAALSQMTTEMLLPDRFRTRNDKGEFVIVPQGAWSKAAGSEQWTPLTINPASMQAAYTAEGFKLMRDGMSAVRELAPMDLDGKSMRHYVWHSDTRYMGVRSVSQNSAWVQSDSGWIVRMDMVSEVDQQAMNTRIDYSAVEGLKIEAPLLP